MKCRVFTLLLTAILVASSSLTADQPGLVYYSDPAYAERNLPFSEAVRAGDLLFLSGEVGVIPGTMELVPGGIQAETRQTLENIGRTLEKYGASYSRVIKCTVFLADMAEWSSMNAVYREFFPNNPPARSALGASGLALGARTEIECIAYVGD